MAYGPVELLVVKFPGNQFTGELVPALQRLVDSDTIQVIDLLFVSKDADGVVDVFEFDRFGDAAFATIDPLMAEQAMLLSEDDARYFGASLEPNSSEALLLFENVWAAEFATALRNAKGEVILNERIPHDVVVALVAGAEA